MPPPTAESPNRRQVLLGAFFRFGAWVACRTGMLSLGCSNGVVIAAESPGPAQEESLFDLQAARSPPRLPHDPWHVRVRVHVHVHDTGRCHRHGDRQRWHRRPCRGRGDVHRAEGVRAQSTGQGAGGCGDRCVGGSIRHTADRHRRGVRQPCRASLRTGGGHPSSPSSTSRDTSCSAGSTAGSC